MKPKRLPKDCWANSSGQVVKIKEMPDDYLLNILTYLENTPALYEGRADQYLGMLEERKRRGL